MPTEAPARRTIVAEFPARLRPLLDHYRYKILYGGRGGAKSWAFARLALILGVRRPLRILCTREIQNSIKESVHFLLKNQIKGMGLDGFYRATETDITGINGTGFIYAGLHHNIASIKSLESVDIVWVEEAQTVSEESWDTLIPTIRKSGSEIWASFNPRLESDSTYQRFILKPPPNALVIKIGWQDNPWLPEELRIAKDHLQQTEPEKYLHVYEGATKSALEGAIYAAEIAQAEKDGRITSLPIDRTKPVNTFWDLGHGDTNSVWLEQTINGWYYLIDYIEGSQKTINYYVTELQQRAAKHQYILGTCWLPHDGVDGIIHQKLAGGDKSRSIEMIMRALGMKVRIAPKLEIYSGINAVRTIFPQCKFDRERCVRGLDGLKQYQWGPVAKSGQERTLPLHDWASHPADALRTMGVSIKEPAPKAPPPPPPPPGGQFSWMS